MISFITQLLFIFLSNSKYIFLLFTRYKCVTTCFRVCHKLPIYLKSQRYYLLLVSLNGCNLFKLSPYVIDSIHFHVFLLLQKCFSGHSDAFLHSFPLDKLLEVEQPDKRTRILLRSLIDNVKLPSKGDISISNFLQ